MSIDIEGVTAKGQTPLNEDLSHPLLEAFEGGKRARTKDQPNPYHGHSLEYALHAGGWLMRDTQMALQKLSAKHTALVNALDALADPDGMLNGIAPGPERDALQEIYSSLK